MKLVDDNFGIRFGKFRCLDTNKVYTITGTKTSHKPEHPHYYDKAVKSIDTIVREDGVRKIMTRRELSVRFTNIESVVE